MRNDFAAFILTHGRADRVETYKALVRSGYTGRIYIVIDDEDEQGDEYRRTYGDRVLVFSKDEVAERFDEGDNFRDRRVVAYARNACFDLARSVGARYFVELDDDYGWFGYRQGPNLEYGGWTIQNIDGIFEAFVRFLETTPALTIAFSQGGDHIGGGNTPIRLKRKAMNSFFCDTERPFSFVGRLNEDVNTYVSLGNRGGLFFTYMTIQLNQTATQTNEGGMTGIYLDCGTYTKSFYSVMFSPSSVRIRDMGRGDRRLHHHINWRATVPKILREEFRKGSPGRERP
jgi:hypothetical protein